MSEHDTNELQRQLVAAKMIEAVETYVNSVFGGDATIGEIVTRVLPAIGYAVVPTTGPEFEEMVRRALVAYERNLLAPRQVCLIAALRATLAERDDLMKMVGEQNDIEQERDELRNTANHLSTALDMALASAAEARRERDEVRNALAPDPLAARVAELEAALRPFANCAERYPAPDGFRPGYGEAHVVIGNPLGGHTNLTVGDLRRARAVLAARPDEKGE